LLVAAVMRRITFLICLIFVGCAGLPKPTPEKIEVTEKTHSRHDYLRSEMVVVEGEIYILDFLITGAQTKFEEYELNDLHGKDALMFGLKSDIQRFVGQKLLLQKRKRKLLAELSIPQ